MSSGWGGIWLGGLWVAGQAGSGSGGARCLPGLSS